MREGEKDVSSLVELRRQQECNVHLAWNYPEADRNISSGAHATAEMTRDGPVADYLSSFLPARLADSPSAVMTPAEARDAKAKCQQVSQIRCVGLDTSASSVATETQSRRESQLTRL